MAEVCLRIVGGEARVPGLPAARCSSLWLPVAPYGFLQLPTMAGDCSCAYASLVAGLFACTLVVALYEATLYRTKSA